MKPRILIVDDEKNIRRMLSMILVSSGYDVSEAATGEEGMARLEESAAEVVLLDIGLPGIDGLETLRVLRRHHPAAGVVMISGQATISAAVEATRLGAIDFLEKPLSKERVLLAVRNALQLIRLDEELSGYRRDEARRHALVGESPALRGLREQVARIAATSTTVLVTGESGTGKELVARLIHDSSSACSGPFVKVNCAAIPEELIETELFGCVRGAYTGADRSREGKFLAADGGTIFLDEIGDMSLRVQAKVLRVLQEREIERVGDSRTIRVDVRVIAATNKDLWMEVEAGRFREDLFYRLNVIPLHVPPLRERRDDIPRLAEHFLALYIQENGLAPRGLSSEALKLLREREWRGNIRELRNVIERLAILGSGAQITADDVQRLAPEAWGARESPGLAVPGLDGIRRMGGLVAARREFERRCIAACLARSGGNITQAARWLRIERSNLHKKIQALGLEVKSRGPEPEEGGAS